MRMRRIVELLLLVLLMALAKGEETCSDIVTMKRRTRTVSVTEFGAVGDGKTLNTAAFQKAIANIDEVESESGTMLYVPDGVWLTGPFNLTSHMTLFLAKNAVIKATKDVQNWPLIAPLPSYGRGRELPGGRYMSFIQGNNLTDIIITGENGRVDGQGHHWWNMWKQKTLLFTRPNLLELMHSTDIIISNTIFQDSPFWNIHPVYSSNVVVKNLTILAPNDSPNTDGVDADSSLNVCIEDCYISTGDDLVAIKSGWDEYGIAYAHPSSNITVRRITGSTQFAGFAIGSENSGGIDNIYVHKLNVSNSGIGVHIKTNSGRGGYIRNVTISEVSLKNVSTGLRIEGNAGDHPDGNYDPKALPVVDGVRISDARGVGIGQPGIVTGIGDKPFTRICLDSVKFESEKVEWRCGNVSGGAFLVEPLPCSELTGIEGMRSCGFGM